MRTRSATHSDRERYQPGMKETSGAGMIGASITLLIAARATAQRGAEPAVGPSGMTPAPEGLRVAADRAPTTGFSLRRVEDLR